MGTLDKNGLNLFRRSTLPEKCPYHFIFSLSEGKCGPKKKSIFGHFSRSGKHSVILHKTKLLGKEFATFVVAIFKNYLKDTFSIRHSQELSIDFIT